MQTNQDRIKYLREKLDQLSSTIEKKNLENKYLKMAEQLKQGLKFEPVSEEEWNLMLPKEKEKNLLAYYHTMRSELHAMKISGTKKDRAGKLKDWLESPWLKVGLTALSFAEVAVKVAELAHQSGLFFSEEKDTDYLD